MKRLISWVYIAEAGRAASASSSTRPQTLRGEKLVLAGAVPGLGSARAQAVGARAQLGAFSAPRTISSGASRRLRRGHSARAQPRRSQAPSARARTSRQQRTRAARRHQRGTARTSRQQRTRAARRHQRGPICTRSTPAH